jgi:hypothetical protein
MTVTNPADGTVSVWVGTLPTEDDFLRCVDRSVSSALSLATNLASISESAFEPHEVSVRQLLEGFSGFETFIESATSAAASRGIAVANCALVCYYLECSNAPDNWGGLRFLGSFPGYDVV